MRILSIDIETYSSVDLAKCGVYRYTQAEDFEILLFGYAFDDEDVRVVDLKMGEKLPNEVYKALTSKDFLKTAFNANFERTCIASYFNIELPPEEWSCTEVMALSLGLPQSLKGAAEFLKLSKQKLSEGKELIRYFTLPCRESKTKICRVRNLPMDNIDKWNDFKNYCKRDVEVEREVRKKLLGSELKGREQELWCLDQRINDRGIRVDTALINNALNCDEKYQEGLKKEAVSLTGVDNPKSTTQMKKWLLDSFGVEVDSLSKEKVSQLLEDTSNEDMKRVLEIRQEISKSSIKKYESMKRSLCKEERIRGLLQFYGASRTGRWAGRLVQVQNLPQIKIKDIDTARALLQEGRFEDIEILYESLPEVLSQLIRTAFIPSSGSRIIAADFSAIEARVLAWLSGETWRINVFNTHGKLYEASASKMFNVPLELIDKGHPLRQKGKIAELALGYQGGKGALLSMGAEKMGLKEHELDGIVSAWRNSNPSIVRLWRAVENSALSAVSDKRSVTLNYGLEFVFEGGVLLIRLPSGRRLSYLNPRIELDKVFMKPYLTYEGTLQATKQWGRLKTYGGKLVENIVQAIARDCLGEAMLRLDVKGYNIVMHVHDEIVFDVPYGFGSIDEIKSIMAGTIPWAPGLRLQADVFEGDYYRKE